MERCGEILWVLNHLADLDADFRAFYRTSLSEAEVQWSGPEFFALAHRTTAYQGVMAARIEAEQGGKGDRTGVEHTDPAVADLFD
jgi:hypothetical protein